jgi:microcompartment protein CcmL/EutN
MEVASVLPAGGFRPGDERGPALALLELDSIAAGIDAGDAMAKRAAVATLLAGTVHPGKYLVLVAGGVAEVEECLSAGEDCGSDHVVDRVILRDVHPGVIAVLGGAGAAGQEETPMAGQEEALGIVETPSVAAILEVADAGLKGAQVNLLQMRLADGLGGKAYLLFGGHVSEVQAAVEIGVSRLPPGAAAVVRMIPRLDRRMRDNLAAEPRFGARLRGPAGEE